LGFAGTDRGRPRLRDHDYLHLRPLARDLEREVASLCARGRLRRVLDVGCGGSPYRRLFGDRVDHYVRLDRVRAGDPSVVARAEALPFADATFDAVLSTQLLGWLDDPARFGREVVRVTRPGGRVLVSGPAAWPWDSARPEHRLGAPDLPGLFPGLEVTGVIAQGGILALPPAMLNLILFEAVRAAERRWGAVARLLRLPATALIVASNLAGRALERLGGRGPFAPFFGALDRRLPMNYLVVGERER
jgi:SAM-dependent methyltransferase